MISFRERNPVRIGIVSLVGLVIALAITFSLNKIPFIAGSYQLNARFADAAGLNAEDEVRIAGIKVGKVTGISLHDDSVVVSMAISRKVLIPQSANAQITLNTILGTKFVAIDARGGGSAFQPGSTISLDRTKIPFEIYQVTDQAVALLGNVDAELLNRSFRALAEIANDPDRDLARLAEAGSKAAGAIATRSESLDELIRKGDTLLTTLDESSSDIRSLIESSNEVLSVLAKRRATVRELLRNTDLLAGSLGGLLAQNRAQIDSVLRDLHAALVIVDSNLRQVEEALRLLGPSTESFARTFWDGRWANICVYAIDPLGAGDPPNGPKGCDPLAP